MDRGEYAKIVVAQIAIDKPYVCQALRPAGTKEKLKENIMIKAKHTQYYSFKVNKIDEIFDPLLADGMIKLTEGQTIPSNEELVDKKYCKWHHSWNHNTADCIFFRKNVQEAI